MKKAFFIFLAAGAVGSAGIIIYTWWWANHGFDNQEKHLKGLQ